MTRAHRRIVALAIALAVIAAGTGYVLTRDVRQSSEATLVLAATPDTREDLPALLDSFDRAGTSGTFVELIASGGVARAAGNPPIDLSVRAVPTSRVIVVRAEGPADVVRPGLRAILAAAQERQSQLGDLWELRVLQTPDGPTASGPSTPVLLVATILLALLAALICDQLLGRAGRGGSSSPVPLAPTDHLSAQTRHSTPTRMTG